MQAELVHSVVSYRRLLVATGGDSNMTQWHYRKPNLSVTFCVCST